MSRHQHHQHHQIARANQQEIVGRALNSHRGHAVDRRRSIKYRLVQIISVLSVCVAAATAVNVSDAHSTPRPVQQHAVHVSARQLMREIRTFQSQGYVPTACTVSGTLMRNYTTDQSVTVAF
jgi:hypothetical protein